MKAILHDAADGEFQEAIEYYLGESHEVAIRFYREVLTTITRIEARPKTWPRLRGAVRKCLVIGFPYKLLYTIEPERILIVAVMHAKRRPGYWLQRL